MFHFVVVLSLVFIIVVTSSYALNNNNNISQITSHLKHLRAHPPTPLNISLRNLYLLHNIYDFTKELAKEPLVDPVAASTLFFSPPGYDHSMGNILSHYMEARLCAQSVGLHFISIDVEERDQNNSIGDDKEQVTSIYSYFDNVILNDMASFPSSIDNLDSVCQCTFRCHESSKALFAREGKGDEIRDVLYPVFKKHSEEMILLENNLPSSVVWRKYLQNDTIDIPPIPDVAIQYRCSDNTIKGYGLLAWPAFLRHIPSNATFIYIMTENPSDRTPDHGVINSCNTIINELSEYLHYHFKRANVVVLRGASALDDATRLAMAQITICSASTFCLWPAIASKAEAFFPVTALIYSDRGRLNYTSELHWLNEPDEIAITLQLMHVTNIKAFIKMLKRGQIVVNGKVVAGVGKENRQRNVKSSRVPTKLRSPNQPSTGVPSSYNQTVPPLRISSDKSEVASPHYNVLLIFFICLVILSTLYRQISTA